jgi:ribosomal protein S17
MTEHELKTWRPYFEDVWEGRKAFEVRKNDRDFQVGDRVILRETGPRDPRRIYATVGYVLSGGQFGIEPGYAVLGLTDIHRRAE